MRFSIPRLVALVALVLLSAWLVAEGADRFSLNRLRQRLGAVEQDGRFPQGYFRNQIKNGSTVQQVCRDMHGYASVHFYLVPLGGGPDSVVVQQFVYPLVTNSLKVGIQYRYGQVADVDTENAGIDVARKLSLSEARRRLGVRSPAPRAGQPSRIRTCF